MKEYVYRACEEIDAAVLSSDLLHDEAETKELLEYIHRWQRVITSFRLKMVPAPTGPLKFPKTVEIVRRNQVKLHLGDCKVVVSLAGIMSLVSPVFGSGYYGRFGADGTFDRREGCTDEMVRKLMDIEERGLDAVKDISRLTGICCVCGRMLTNEVSIEEGIGPICAGRFR